MFSEINSTTYFVNHLALCILLVPLYYFTPWAFARRILLTLAGSYLVYFVAPRLLLFYVIFWTLIFLLQRIVAYTEDRKLGDVVFWISLTLALLPMIIWKFWSEEFNIAFNVWGNYWTGLVNLRLGEIDFAREIIIPIGLSFATFRAVDLLVKSYIGRFKGLSLDRVLFYGFFPPIQVVGPIIEYDEIYRLGDQAQKTTTNDFYHGFLRISFGLIKVLVIANLLQGSAIIFTVYASKSFYIIWSYLFLYMWFFYLNFSGYSDLAIGTSRFFGYKLKENFNLPYFRPNIADFWNNWHMSLSRFAQRNAFVPLGGYRKKTQHVAIFATIMVIALWHDLSLGMLVFGIYHGVGLVTHRIFIDYAAKNKGPEGIVVSWAKIAATNVFVALSFPLLAMPLGEVGPFYLALFGM
ncbi:hypothetical protein N9063_00380 [Deltaproteobacteria bacterium]|nr:hypothetical protein [Deltaproteobacteria bacterium]